MASEGTLIGTEKRFSLPDGGIGHERLSAAQAVVRQIQAEHPEVLSLCVFGSSTTGTAKETSDIDGWLFIDVSRLTEQTGLEESYFVERAEDNKIFQARKTIRLKESVRERYNHLVRDKLQQQLGLTDQQLQHIRSIPISPSIIDALTQDLHEWDTQEQKYLAIIEENNRKLDAHNTDITSAKKPYRPNLGILPDMFHLAIGKGIEPWRAMLLRKLDSFGESGERIWREIITTTEMMENHMNSGTDKAYPRTLDKAIQVYGNMDK